MLKILVKVFSKTIKLKWLSLWWNHFIGYCVFLNFSWARIWQCLYVCLSSGAWGLKKWWDVGEILHTCSLAEYLGFFIFQKFWFFGPGEVLKKLERNKWIKFQANPTIWPKSKAGESPACPKGNLCYLILNIWNFTTGSQIIWIYWSRLFWNI